MICARELILPIGGRDVGYCTKPVPYSSSGIAALSTVFYRGIPHSALVQGSWSEILWGHLALYSDCFFVEGRARVSLPFCLFRLQTSIYGS